MTSSYFATMLVFVGLNIALALSLQFVMGVTGRMNLALIALFGLGAYTSALLAVHGAPFWLAFIAAGAMCTIVGGLLTIPTHRLRGDYLILVTISFSYVFYAIVINWMSLTHGPIGIAGIPRPVIFGWSVRTPIAFASLMLGFAALVYLFLKRLVASPFGRVLQALRDDEQAVETLGKNPFWLKTKAFAVSGAIAGLTGSLFAHYLTYIDPSSFAIAQIIPFLSMVIIAGLASLEGTVVTATVLTLLPEALRFVGLASSQIGAVRQFIYALLILVILLWRPMGLFGRVKLES